VENKKAALTFLKVSAEEAGIKLFYARTRHDERGDFCCSSGEGGGVVLNAVLRAFYPFGGSL